MYGTLLRLYAKIERTASNLYRLPPCCAPSLIRENGTAYGAVCMATRPASEKRLAADEKKSTLEKRSPRGETRTKEHYCKADPEKTLFSTGDLLSGTITCVCMLSSFVFVFARNRKSILYEKEVYF